MRAAFLIHPNPGLRSFLAFPGLLHCRAFGPSLIPLLITPLAHQDQRMPLAKIHLPGKLPPMKLAGPNHDSRHHQQTHLSPAYKTPSPHLVHTRAHRRKSNCPSVHTRTRLFLPDQAPVHTRTHLFLPNHGPVHTRTHHFRQKHGSVQEIMQVLDKNTSLSDKTTNKHT